MSALNTEYFWYVNVTEYEVSEVYYKLNWICSISTSETSEVYYKLNWICSISTHEKSLTAAGLDAKILLTNGQFWTHSSFLHQTRADAYCWTIYTVEEFHWKWFWYGVNASIAISLKIS